MKMSMLIGLSIFAAGLAGMSGPAAAGSGIAGRWSGVLLRDGVRVPISVELNGVNRDLSGRLQAGDAFAPIESVRATATGVHFEVPGEGIFDGTVAADSMAGSVSGSAASGSFSLTRETESPFADPITSSGP
ncbi:MAG: hypothetical protein E6J61_12605 [Deltaproteobacteria bacterium]|nr:MAG: hypothetical protein E6J61_12605 [Deltaproteobacteria bacterium]